jgi:membrane-associated protease RseP (regulator of RpoE activity)
MGLPPLGKPDASAFLGVVGEYRVGLYGEVEVVRAYLLPGLRGDDPEVLAALEAWGGEVHVYEHEGETEVMLVRPSGPRRNRWLLHASLFLLTLVTTLAAGAIQLGVDPVHTRSVQIGGGAPWPFPTGIDLTALWTGAGFALPFLGILLAHESGHYLAARKHKIPVTPPYFIPFPPWYSLVGTLGAFIRIKGPTVRRSVLLDVAAAGPFASFLLSLPALLLGLAWSSPDITATADLATPFLVRFGPGTVHIGNGPLLHMMGSAFFPGTFGVTPIELHPLAFAGWLGLFITALNLLPLGQLDGGHILYCLWEQPGQVWAARLFVAALVPMGMIWWGWWLWGGAALLVNRGRLRHPPVVHPAIPLTPARAFAARLAILIFFLTFVPVPLA